MGSQCQACAWRGYIYISDHIYIYSEISATMGEGEAVPAAVADIKIFISGHSGSNEISTAQQKITMILKSLGIPILQVDISAPGMDDQRDVMRASAKKKEGQRHALPPQIFHGEKYCGDYDDFDVANEDDELEEFLCIPRKTPKAVPGKPEEEATKEDAEKPPTSDAVPADAAPVEVAPVAEAPPAEEVTAES